MSSKCVCLFLVGLLITGCNSKKEQPKQDPFLDDAIKVRAEAEALQQHVVKLNLPSIEADKSYKEGNLLYDKGLYERSIESYNQATDQYKAIVKKSETVKIASVPEVKPPATQSQPTQAQINNQVEEIIKVKELKKDWDAAWTKADKATLSKYNPDDFKRLQNMISEASKAEPKKAASLYTDAISLLKDAEEKADQTRKSEMAQDLIKQLKQLLARSPKKWEAEDLIEQIEAIAPADKETIALRKRVNALPGPTKTLTLDIGKGMKMEFVLVRPGTFTMGDDHNPPAHKVTITKPFYIGKYEVTQEQWKAVMSNNPSPQINDKFPVCFVNWGEIQPFIRAIERKTSRELSLPTEAQWEYAAQLGNSDNLDEFGWVGGGNGLLHDVGTKKADSLGLYDMRGNVWEWVNDWYEPYSAADQTDPTGPSNGTMRIVRGGSTFTNAADRLTATNRMLWKPDAHDYAGFRLVVKVK